MNTNVHLQAQPATWLVTGAAGFIGMHTSLRLLARGDRVIGLDNLNDYYDVSLKLGRLAQLQSHANFSFHQLDVANREGLAALGMTLRWEGTGTNEIAYTVVPGASQETPIVRIDPRYFRPTEVETLLGDPTKAKQKLGWVPEITAQEMCAEMVAYDLAQAKQHALLKNHGYKVNVSVE